MPSSTVQRGSPLLLLLLVLLLQKAGLHSLLPSRAALHSLLPSRADKIQRQWALGIVLRHPLLSASVLELSEGTAKQGAPDGDEKFVTQ